MNAATFLCSIITCIFYLSLNGTYQEPFKLGLENLTPFTIKKHALNTRRVGLVTNQTGCDQQGTPNVKVLQAKGVNITTIFAPEHGYAGTVAAGKSVDDTSTATDAETIIPVVSLYKKENGLIGRTVNSEQLNKIDALIFDMQDSGMRHYTYISTLMRCLEMAATYKKPIFVLDRPNLLGPHMEGPLVDTDLISFISIAPIPVRYGMTIGELARYFNRYVLKEPAPLYVIPMKGYTRQLITQLSAPLSPNIQTIQACYGYSFLGLLGEVRPFDVGVGTPDAFQVIMLPRSLKTPESVWQAAQDILLKHNVTSSRYAVFSERKKEYFEGLRIQIPDINAVRSFDLFLRLVTYFHKQGVQLSFAPTFDKAVGVHAVRSMFAKTCPVAVIKKTYTRHLEQFHKKACSIFLYTPHPRIVH
jgi:uncharacterized protein YbbC (DUF1343 family)